MNESLLSIDVEAEMFKLSVGRLQSSDQVPVALARLAAQFHAATIEIDLTKNRLTLEHDGKTPSVDVLTALRVLLDRNQNDVARHEALEKLEKYGMLDLLVAFASNARWVGIDMGPPIGQCMRLEKGGGGLAFSSCRRAKGMRIEILGATRSVSREIGELKRYFCYAGYRVIVNSRRIDQGFFLNDVMFETRFDRDSISGVVGLPSQGLAAVTRILSYGVLKKEVWLSPQDGWVWDAVVEAPDDMPQKAVIDKLRKEVGGLYARACREYSKHAEGEKHRIKQLLFRLADFAMGAEAVEGVNLFRTVSGEWVDIQGVRQIASERVVKAIGTKTVVQKYTLFGNELVLEEQDRGFIERHLGLMVRDPPRHTKRRLVSVIPAWVESVRKGLYHVLARLTVGRVVPPVSLREDERRFLQALNQFAASGLFGADLSVEVVFADKRLGMLSRSQLQGRKAVRMILSRKNKNVQSMIRAFDRDPKSLYPALMLLTDGQATFADKSGQLLVILSQPDGRIGR